MDKVMVGNRWVGPGEPCYIIAEAGSNHNGSLEQAIRLIDVAVDAGADAVKFQTFKAHRLYLRSAGQPDYLKDSRSIYDIIHDMEMPDHWIPQLSDYCKQNKIDFMSTPFDEDSADLLNPYLSAFKNASYEMTHTPLLRHVARKGKPIFVSTGTANMEEVLQAVETIKDEGNLQVVLLQCTAMYPAPLTAANVRAMVTLKEITGLPVGLSDHTREPLIAPVAAASLGASVIEKHYTLSNHLPGPDHKFALEPRALSNMIEAIRQTELALGHGRKEMLDEEAELHAFARRSIFAIQDISPGELITKHNIAVLRRGNIAGELAPSDYMNVLGKRALRTIVNETAISSQDFC